VVVVILAWDFRRARSP